MTSADAHAKATDTLKTLFLPLDGQFRLVWKSRAKSAVQKSVKKELRNVKKELNSPLGKLALDRAKLTTELKTVRLPQSPQVFEAQLNATVPNVFNGFRDDLPSCIFDAPAQLSIDPPDVDFLDALFDGAVVDLSAEFGGFLLDAGLGSIPIIHTFSALFKVAKSGVGTFQAYNTSKDAQRTLSKIRFQRNYIAGADSAAQAAHAEWFTKGMMHVFDTRLKREAAKFGSYAVDAAVSFVDPTPISGVVFACGRAIAHVISLYLQWKTVLEVNSVLRGATSFDLAIFEQCPLLFCYLLRNEQTADPMGHLRRGAIDAGQGGAPQMRSRISRALNAELRMNALIRANQDRLSLPDLATGYPYIAGAAAKAEALQHMLALSGEMIEKSPFELAYFSASGVRQDQGSVFTTGQIVESAHNT